MLYADTYVKLTVLSPNGQEIARSKTSVRRGQPHPLFKETFMFQAWKFELFTEPTLCGDPVLTLICLCSPTGRTFPIAWRHSYGFCLQQTKYETQGYDWLVFTRGH